MSAVTEIALQPGGPEFPPVPLPRPHPSAHAGFDSPHFPRSAATAGATGSLPSPASPSSAGGLPAEDPPVTRRAHCREWIFPTGFQTFTAPWWSAPTLLGRAEEVDKLVEALEIRYLGTLRDPNPAPSPCDRFSRRPGTHPAGGLLRPRPRGHPRAVMMVTAEDTAVHLLSPSPASCGIPTKRCGWAMSASAASRSSSTPCCAAGSHLRLLGHRRRCVDLVFDQVCHHPGYRHATAPRRGAQIHRKHRPSAQ